MDRSVLYHRTNVNAGYPISEEEDGWGYGAEADISHHSMTFESVILNPNVILGERYMPIARPANVQKAAFTVNDIPMECWHSTPTEEPQAIIGFLPGTKMPGWAYSMERNILHSMGFAITALSQTNAMSKTGFVPHHVDAAEAFIFDRNSPLYTMGRPDIPRIILTHSASGPYAIRAALNAAKKGLSVRMPAMLHTAPCLAPAGASDIFAPLRAKLYKWHTEQVPDMVCGQHWRDKAILWPRGVNLPQKGPLKHIFFWSNGSTLQRDERYIPTHGQSREIMDFGYDLMTEIYSFSSALPWEDERQRSLSAQNDFASCALTAKVFGETIGKHHMVPKGDHAPIDKSPEAREIFKSVISDFMEQSRRPVLVHSSDKPAVKLLPAPQQIAAAAAAPATI